MNINNVRCTTHALLYSSDNIGNDRIFLYSIVILVQRSLHMSIFAENVIY